MSASLADRARDARALADAGRMSEAEPAYAAILREQPDHLDALQYLALCAHHRGRRQEARSLLETAAAAHPADSVVLTNLGVMAREDQQLEQAVDFFSRALRHDASLSLARLRLAETLQALGRHDEALPAYFGAVMSAQTRGEWMNEATTPAPLRPLVLHAMRAIDVGRRHVFDRLLAPLHERHGHAALLRVENCLAIYLGELPAQYADPAQRPKFLYFPDLPPHRVHPREKFPWYAELEAESIAIRDEMLAALAEDSGFEPFLGHVDAQDLQGYLGGDGTAPAWNALFFYRHGERRDAAFVRCPRTAAALERVPLCRIREHAPEVCYSVLTPGSHILPHRGVTNTRLVTHLPLVVPEGDLALHVSGHVQRWETGRCFSFDDTFEHEAWNRSAETRVVMLMDVWNPYLTEVEREALTTLIAGIGDFNRAAGV